MSREEIQKLLGGYATGTLTTAEQQALFEAALEDQQLFDQLAREQALHDLLREPAARAQVLQALEQPRRGWFARPLAWWPAAAAAACAALVLMFVVRHPQRPVEVARVQPQENASSAAPAQTPPAVAAPAPVPPAAPKNEPAPARRQDRAAKPPAFAAPVPEAPRELKDQRTNATAEKQKEETQKKDANAAPAAINGAVGGVSPALARESLELAAAPANSINVNELDQTVRINNLPPQTAQSLFYDTRSAAPYKTAAQSAGAVQPQQQQRAPAQQQPAPAQQQVVAGARQFQFQMQQVRDQMVFPGFRYRVLRQLPGGESEGARADNLKSGDTVKIEFTFNVGGYLRVMAGDQPLTARPVNAHDTFATSPLRPGTTEVTVDFLPQGLPPVSVTRVAGSSRAANVVERKPGETYVVAVPPSTERVHFTIQLRYQ